MGERDGSSVSSRGARNLKYTAEVPSFLQSLHASVHRRNGDQSDTGARDVGSAAAVAAADDAKRNGKRDHEDDNDDDDLADAQVVVLREGKHLTREEYERTQGAKKGQDAAHEATSAAEASAAGLAGQEKRAWQWQY